MLLQSAVALATVLLVSPVGSGATARAASAPRLRILYASDWTGPMEIFAADPSGRVPVQQVTFARPDGPCYSAAACGYSDPQPSPDGRWLAYWSESVQWEPRTLWLARADGSQPRSLGPAFEADWSPESGKLAYLATDGLHVLTTMGSNRIVDHRQASSNALRWSPDGRSLAFGSDRGLVLLRNGHERLLARDVPDSLAWSPDGRHVAYSMQKGIFVVPTAGGLAKQVYQRALTIPDCEQESAVEYSPDGRVLGFQFDGTPGFLDTRTWRARTFAPPAQDISWSPDGRSLLFVSTCADANGDAMTTGDVRSITPSGHIGTLVSAAKAYGGQITSAAWTTVPADVHYRAAQPVSGAFANGPVQKLAADGDRVAYAACGGVAVWSAVTGTTASVQTSGSCQARFSRTGHVGTLALAGRRVLWWSAYTGLGLEWSMYQATLGAPPAEVASGYGNLGVTPPDGAGTAVGSGSLLVMSAWTHRLNTYPGPPTVDQQSIERVDPAGCPCPAISSSPGPDTPLDVDQGRIVASDSSETRVLAADGTVLLSVPEPTQAAQLSGNQLVLTTGNQLQVYDASTGLRTATWSLPAGPVGHDCDFYGDPSCDAGGATTPPVYLEDVSRGLAAYIYNGRVHLLRLSDGADRVVTYGTLARFTNEGLVYADGARISLTPYDKLPLR